MHFPARYQPDILKCFGLTVNQVDLASFRKVGIGGHVSQDACQMAKQLDHSEHQDKLGFMPGTFKRKGQEQSPGPAVAGCMSRLMSPTGRNSKY